MLSALLHEAGHLTAIKAVGGNVRRVDIMPLGARIVTSGTMAHVQDIAVYLCGPVANLVFFSLSLPLALAVRSPYCLYFSLANLFLALVNLLPVSGNDGFCVLSAAVSRKAQGERLYSALNGVRRLSEAVFCLLSFTAVFASGFNPGVIGLTTAANIYKKD